MIAEEHAEAFGERPDELTMRDVDADVLGEVEGDEESTLLGAARADASLLAGEGDKELVAAAGAADAGEAVAEVAALEEGADGAVVDGPPVAVGAGVLAGPGGAEVLEVIAKEAVEVGFEGLTGAVDACGLGQEADHGSPSVGDGLCLRAGPDVGYMLGIA
jgi:hypothetical protein